MGNVLASDSPERHYANTYMVFIAMTPVFALLWSIVHHLENPETSPSVDECIDNALQNYSPVPVLFHQTATLLTRNLLQMARWSPSVMGDILVWWSTLSKHFCLGSLAISSPSTTYVWRKIIDFSAKPVLIGSPAAVPPIPDLQKGSRLCLPTSLSVDFCMLHNGRTLVPYLWDPK